jgi:UDP-2-acetamido-3-amino-2,3-dideoxy-glucuronate N-acetyltransferase
LNKSVKLDGCLRQFVEDNGTLVPIDFSELIFVPRRVFYVAGVPAGDKRGQHAHYETQQLLICVKGKISVHLYDGYKTETIVMEENESVFVDRMIWDSQTYETGEDIMLSLCSTEYDKADYIEDIKEFDKIIRTN